MALCFFKVDEWQRNFETSRTINNWYNAFVDKVSDLNLASKLSAVGGHRATSAGLRESDGENACVGLAPAVQVDYRMQ